MAENDGKPSVFISYKRTVDANYFVRQLKRDLEANGYSVWLDMESIPSGSDWHGAIGTGLQECTSIIPIITQGYIESRFCMNELYTADGDKKLIFPIMYEDVDLVSTEGGRALKFIVSGINWTMFRPGKDEYSESLQKLIKGMKGKEKELAEKVNKLKESQKAEEEEKAVIMSVGPASAEPTDMISGIEYPTHIATGRNGEIVIASYMSHKVYVYGKDHQLLCTFGSNGFMDGQFMCPSGIAVDRHNRIYVSSLSKVDVFTMEGQFINAVGQQGDGPLQFSNATGIAVSKEGVIYVVDSQNHRVQILNSDLTFRASFSEGSKTLGSGRLSQPQAIAINSKGNLYVADMMNHAVQVFSPEGEFLLRFGKYGAANVPGSVCTPMAVAIDGADNVYVSSTTGTIGIFDKEGTFLRQFGSYGSELGQFNMIKGMHVDRKGRLYVTEWTVNRIQIFQGSPSMVGPETDGDSAPAEDPEPKDVIVSKPAYLIGPKSTLPSETLSGIREASGVAIGRNGEVVVGSWKHHKVYVYDSKNEYKQIGEIGGKGDDDGCFINPTGITVTHENHVLVTSFHKVQWFTMDGRLVHVVGGYGDEIMQFNSPVAVAMGKDGRVFVLDSNNKRVQILSSDAIYCNHFELPRLPVEDDDEEDKDPSNYTSLAINSEGNLYVTQSNKGCVRVFSSDGESLFKFGKSGPWTERGTLTSPMAIAIDADDNVFVASIMMVSIFDKAGSYIRAFGGHGSDPGQFNFIKGLCIDSRGWLYVSEYRSNRVQIFEGTAPTRRSNDNSDLALETIPTLSSRKPAYMVGPTSNSPIKILTDINSPHNVAEGGSGEVIVVSQRDNKVLVYSPANDYQLVAEIGGKGELDGMFVHLHSVAVTLDNLILMTSHHKLQWFTMDGKLAQVIGEKGSHPLQFDQPSGVAVGRDGTIYIINVKNKRLDILNGDGTYNRFFKFSHLESERVDPPCPVAVNSENNLYFADSKNSCIHVYSSDGEYLFKFGKSGSRTMRGTLSSPAAIAIDADDNVFIGDSSKVSIFDKSGSFIRAFGGSGKGSGQFSRIEGLCIGKNGYIYVSEYNNSRVQIFEGNRPSEEHQRAVPEDSSAKSLSTRRPLYTIGPSSDKPGVVIPNVTEPWGMAVSPDGSNLFVVARKEKKVLVYGSPDFELRETLDKLYWETTRDNEVTEPKDVAVCEDGCLLLSLKSQLAKITMSGEVIASVGKKGRRGKENNELDDPNGIVIGRDGRVYVVDSGNSRLQVFNPDLSYRGTGIVPDSRESPPYLKKAAIDSQGSVYVTDKRHDCVHIFDRDGKFLFSFGKRGGRSNDRGSLSSPMAIAIDHEDYIYVTSSSYNIAIFDREGFFMKAFGTRGTEPGQFGDISSMCIDCHGNLHVCDSKNNSIQIFTGVKAKEEGAKDRTALLDKEEAKLDSVLPAKTLPQSVQCPCGIAEGKSGEIVVASSSSHQVFVFDHNCRLLVQFGGKGEIDGRFNSPTSVAITSDDYILVSSRDKLQWFTMQGQLVYAVGANGRDELEFKHPDCMALSKDGRIYVLEKQNKRVQILNGNGTYHNSFGLKLDPPPEALAVNSEGVIFLVDTRGNCIERFSSDGTHLSRFSSSGGKQPALPMAISIDSEDNVYIGTAHGIVYVFDKEGNFLSAFRGSGRVGQFSIISGLHMGQSGRVYISDYSSNQVQILGKTTPFSPTRTTTLGFSSPPVLLPYRPVFTVGPKSPFPVRIISGVQDPTGIATDPSGNIFVASGKGKKILIFGLSDSQPVSSIAEFKNPTDPRNKKLSCPYGVAFSSDGYLLVTYNHQLVKMTHDGTVVAFVGNAQNCRGKTERELDNPGGVVVRNDGQIFLVDSGNHRIQILQSDLTYVSSLFNPEEKERAREYLEHAAINSAGELFVTDRRNSNVQVFNKDGKFLFTFGKSGSWKSSNYKRGQLSSPRAIAIDREDFVYVGGDDGIVTIFNRKGEFVRYFGGFGDQPGEFADIRGMHIDYYGQLYVCDKQKQNSRIQVFQGQY